MLASLCFAVIVNQLVLLFLPFLLTLACFFCLPPRQLDVFQLNYRGALQWHRILTQWRSLESSRRHSDQPHVYQECDSKIFQIIEKHDLNYHKTKPITIKKCISGNNFQINYYEKVVVVTGSLFEQSSSSSLFVKWHLCLISSENKLLQKEKQTK